MIWYVKFLVRSGVLGLKPENGLPKRLTFETCRGEALPRHACNKKAK